MKTAAIVALLCAAMPALHACHGDCAGIGLTEIRPGTERTINLGASFAAEYREGGTCAGSDKAHLDQREMRWWTIDTLVVRVDSAPGARHWPRGWARLDALPRISGRGAEAHRRNHRTRVLIGTTLNPNARTAVHSGDARRTEGSRRVPRSASARSGAAGRGRRAREQGLEVLTNVVPSAVRGLFLRCAT